MSRRSTSRRRRNRPSSQAPRVATATTPRLTGAKLDAVLSVLLAAVTIALYSPVLGHSLLVLDDREYVTANPHIHEGIRWSTVKWAFTATEAANWHPLTWLSHALDYQLFALNPLGHHLDNVLIHALNAVLLFLVLLWMTKRRGPSLAVAALFALHPLNVESVAWIAERKNVLSTLFFILAIGAYAWYARKPDWPRYIVVAALFVAGLLAKPMLVTLPFVFLLLDYWPLERTSFGLDAPADAAAASNASPQIAISKLVLEKVPLLFLSAASSWMTLKAQRVVVHTFEEFSLSTRIENALVAYALYLWKMIWPAHLAFYPYSIFPLPAWEWILSALVLATITVFVVRFRSKRYLPVGWFWFLGTLVPVIGLVQVGEASMADRYAYVPLIGIFIIVAWGLADLADAKNVVVTWRVVPALGILAALGWVTFAQIGYWESDYDLWSHTLEIAETPLAHNAVGAVLMDPDAKMTPRDLENFTSAQKRMAEARRHFERALQLREPLAAKNPDASRWDIARTLNNLGNLDRMQNRLREAREHDESALQIYRQLARENASAYEPYLASILNNLGAIDQRQNRIDEARQHYDEALKIDRQLVQENPTKYLPNMAMMLNEFAMLGVNQKTMDQKAGDEARAHFEEALKIDRQLAEQSPDVYQPQLAMTLENFGMLDAVQSQMDEAHGQFDEALKIERRLAERNPAVYLPDVAMTLSNVGRVEQIQNRVEESRAHYEEALSILQKLSQGDNRYASGVARIKAGLAELNAKAPPQVPR